jgi:16S rRNA (uracil1498-N3)-methyltransferase
LGCYRFFVDVERFESQAEVVLEGSEAYHARRVMRVEVGDQVSLVNGRGWYARATVESIEKRKVLFRVLSCEEVEAPSRELWLGLANLRSNHLDFAIEKGVEVGVDHFVLFIADGSEIRTISEARQRRIRALIQAAVKQCGRVFSPEIQISRGLKQALQIMPKKLLWAHLSDQAKALSTELEKLDKGTVCLCIGPEKGWSDREVALLEHRGPSVCLHENVLRSETAAIVGSYEIARWFCKL